MKTGLYISLLVLAAVTAANCKAHSKHGHSKSKDAKSRIIDGMEATESQFPWQVYMKSNFRDFCAGSIISEDWVLTAASCVNPRHMKEYELVFGSLDHSADGPGAVSMVEHKENHYVPKETDYFFQDNIALIKLSSPLSWSSNIQPIRLPSRSQLSNDFLGETVEVSGWGAPLSNDPESFSLVLLWADSKVISKEDCADYQEEVYGGGDVITDSIICAFNEKEKNLCLFDAGDPLVWQDPADGNWTQVGVAGIDSENCFVDAPGVYARVTSHMEWISEVTGIPIS